jgi:hypothetical protein
MLHAILLAREESTIRAVRVACSVPASCYWFSKWAHIWPQTKVKRTFPPLGVVADRG